MSKNPATREEYLPSSRAKTPTPIRFPNQIMMYPHIEMATVVAQMVVAFETVAPKPLTIFVKDNARPSNAPCFQFSGLGMLTFPVCREIRV